MQPTTVIMGAGITGKCTAKLLAQRSSRVILIDKNFAPVPQSNQLHVLLGAGQELIKKHFPKVYEKIQINCPQVNWGSETYWRTPAGPMAKRPLNVSTYLLSRSYLDDLLLDDLRQTTNCEFIHGSVKDLRLSENKNSVEAVILADGQEISCDICIDSLGRHSISKKILEREFSQPVSSKELRTSLKYYTMISRRKTEGEFKQAYFQIDPAKESYGGVISPIEGGRLIATFISIDNTLNLTDNPFHLIKDKTFQQFVSEIEFEPEITAFGQLHNIRHHFEDYHSLPANLFLIGDSVCQLNPVYGQGMTLALQSATLLEKFLLDGNSPSQKFQKLLSKIIEFPWTVATLDSYHQNFTPTYSQRLKKYLLHRVIHKSKKSEPLHQLLVSVLHMQENPKKLLSLRNLV
jgi:flavin-dependent dehydrogenase